MKLTQGATITSVLVATALAGIVAAVVSQLITNQAKVMRTLTLREERENLLKHYRNTLVSGWDNTLNANCANLYDRDGNIAVPSGGIKSKSEDLYAAASDGWWEVKFTCRSKSGSIFGSDKYEKTSGSGLHSETHREVTLEVNFLKDKHPHISSKLAQRKETFYMHQNKRLAADTDCRNESNRTRMNYLSGAAGSALYKGDGAIIQYDFNTNYVKCSQVPLVIAGSCAHDAAIIGFWGTGERTSSGEYVCSHYDTQCSAANPYVRTDSAGNKHCSAVPTPDSVLKPGVAFHPKVDALAKTPPHGEDNLITAYVGSGDGTNKHMHNFGNTGCQSNSTLFNHTYVSYIDNKGTAYCQTTRHVVENNVRCNTYPHPGVPASAYHTTTKAEPAGIVDAWGDTGNPLGNGADELRWQREIEDEMAKARARYHTPPGIPTNYFSRVERDPLWHLGSGGFKEFTYFNHSKGPGYLVSKTETPDCSEPGYLKGPVGPRGSPGANGAGKGEKGEPGKQIWVSSP